MADYTLGETETVRQIKRLLMAKRKEPRRSFTSPVTPAEGKMVIAVQEKLARIRQMLAREAARKRQERRSNPSSLTTATLDATFALSSRPSGAAYREA